MAVKESPNVTRERDGQTVGFRNEIQSAINSDSVITGDGVTVEVGPIEFGGSFDDPSPWGTFYKGVKGRHNRLHDYNVYNYNIALVALSKDQVEKPETYQGRVFTNGQENKGFYVVARSGGYGRTEEGGFKQGRDKDVFIDALNFETLCGINSQGTSNLTKGQMRFVEPYGVAGLYEELFAGAAFAGHPNYIRAPFLLVISFVGRRAGSDIDGQPEVPDKTTRYIPIMFTKSDMTVTESGATYEAEFIAYNALSGANIRKTLVDDVEGVSRESETVESVLYHLFEMQNRKHEEQIEKSITALKDKGTSVKEFLAERKEKAQKGLAESGNAGYEITAFKPDKWCLWFAKDWKNPKSFNTKNGTGYESWKGKISKIIDPKQKEPGTIGGLYTNEFATKKFNDGFLPTPSLKIKEFDEAVDDQKDALDAQRKIISDAKSVIEASLATYEAQREALVAQAKIYGVVLDEKKSSALDIKTSTKPDVILEETTKKTTELTNIAEAIKENPTSMDDLAAVNVGQQQADLPTVTTIMSKINEMEIEILVQANAIKTAESQIKGIQNNVGTLRNKPYTLFGENASPWTFKKGLNLESAINLIINNSDYMEIFSKKEMLDEIVEFQEIPWYRIDIYPEILGYDVAKQDFSYTYHFVVSPYYIHYSKFPGIQIVFSTDKRRQLAVREYNYIYTGKNLDVLSFNIKYNNLFFTPLLMVPPTDESSSSQTNAKPEKNVFTPRTMYEKAINDINNKISGHLGKAGGMPSQMVTKPGYRRTQMENRADIALALQDMLYNPPSEQSLIRAEIEILGDPVYIIGSGILDRPDVTSQDPEVFNTGEMNTFTREPDIIFNIRYPEDIPTAKELDENTGTGQYELKRKSGTGYSGLYQVARIENRFNEGTFTQQILGLRRPNQEKDDVKVASNTDPQVNLTDTEGPF